jgi:hypothetical protein
MMEKKKKNPLRNRKKKKKKKRIIFRCQDLYPEISKSYKFVRQPMLVSNDGIKIRSSLYERAKKIDVFSTVGIRTRKFQSHINLCYSRCWYHMMEYKSHQAYVKGQKNKKKNYFPLPRFKPENFKVINLCCSRCWYHMME